MSDDRVRVKAVDRFGDPGREFIEVDGVEVGVFCIDGDFYAVENECAHEGGPVCRGEVRNELCAEPGDTGDFPVEEFDGDKTVACPWHGYTYYLETGEHIGDGDLALATYNVSVEDGVVYIN